MEEKKILQVEVEKQPIGRPPKALETLLVKMEKSPPKTKKVRGQYTNWFAPFLWGPIHSAIWRYRNIHYALKHLKTVLVKMKKSPPKTKKVRGQYTNWLAPSLWGPIHLAVQKYRSIHYALKHLKTMYKIPGESQCVYENLSRGSMYEWFTSRGELKEGYKQYIDNGSFHFQWGTQHCPILTKHLEVEELIIQTLKGHRKAGQPLYARLVRILIISIIKKKAPELLFGGRTDNFLGFPLVG